MFTYLITQCTVEITEICPHTFLAKIGKKVRESNVFARENTKDLFSRNIFTCELIFLFPHCENDIILLQFCFWYVRHHQRLLSVNIFRSMIFHFLYKNLTLFEAKIDTIKSRQSFFFTKKATSCSLSYLSFTFWPSAQFKLHIYSKVGMH